jgi:ubiquinone biosynthesis protein
MLFKDGFFHGDLHPGNVFLEDDGRLGLIDFGMVGRLSRQNREKIVDVLFSLMNEDLEGVARIWFSLGRPGPQVDYAAFEAEVVDVLERHIVGRQMEEWDLGMFFRDLAAGAVRHGIRLPADFTMMFKAMVTTEGLARQIAAGVNPVEAARPYIEALVKERYSVERVKRMAIVEGIRVTDLVRELPGALERIIGRLEHDDLALRIRHEGHEEPAMRVVRALNRASVSVVIAAASLTGALTMGRGPEIALGLSPIGLAAFGIAFVGLVWLVVGVLKGR